MSSHLLSRPSLSIVEPEVTVIRRDCYFRDNIEEVNASVWPCEDKSHLVHLKKSIEGAHVGTVLQRSRKC
jgi:hypothetical protein